jgi:hypothetical protein
MTYDDLVQASKDNKGQKQRYKVEIGPTLAQQLLDGRSLIEDFGFRQVPFDKNLLTQYTNAQTEGEWEYGVNSINLGFHKGKLVPINGNHTLKSVTLSGKVITIDVWVNTPIEDFPKFDNKGMGRTLAEQLYTQFSELTKAQSAIIGDFIPKAVLAIEQNAFGKVSASTVSDQTSTAFFVSTKDDALEATNFVLASKCYFRPNTVALVYFLGLRQGLLTEEVVAFLTDLREGVPSRKNNPAFKLLKKAQRMGKNFRQREIQATMFWVANKLIEGADIGNLGMEEAPFSLRAPLVLRPKRARGAKAGS